MWDLKDRINDFSINWEILPRTKNKFYLKYGCTLCTMEKHENSKLKLNLALDKRNKLFSNFKHFSSFFKNNFEGLCKLSVSYIF